MNSAELPKLVTGTVPGPRSRELIAKLARFESPGITARRLKHAARGGIDCPIVWQRSSGALVEDVDGNLFLDMTGGFGVASLGHSRPEIVTAASAQLELCGHVMGDVFPSASKVRLAERLAEITPGNLSRSLFACAGFEAVEGALKTAMLRTGKPGVLSFENAYHGLGYGALCVTDYRPSFRAPFREQLGITTSRVPFPNHYRFDGLASALSSDHLDRVVGVLDQCTVPVGAIIIEPIQGRGGVLEAPADFLRGLRDIASARGILLIFDEILTGFGRTAKWFACEHAGVVPDIICVGKALSGGFPISAAIATEDAMLGWADPEGEAIHTSTFLGNPVGCEMALASIDIIEAGALEMVAHQSQRLLGHLERLNDELPAIGNVRGKGLMLGIELVTDPTSKAPATQQTLAICQALLSRGIIVLPAGIESNILCLTPPFVLTDAQCDFFANELRQILLKQRWN